MPASRFSRRTALGRALAAGGALALYRAEPILAATGAGIPDGVVFELGLGDALWRTSAARAAGGWLTSPPVRAPRRFDLLGIEWTSPRDPRIEVRVLDGGGWSRWINLSTNRGHAPDGPQSDRLLTDPVLTGNSQVFQLRVSLPLQGARVHFVNSTGTTTAAGRARAALEKLLPAAAGRLATPVLSAGPGQPRIIARSAWTGAGLRPRVAPEYGRVALAFVHHTETANSYGPGQSAAMIRAIGHYHRDVRGWNDIGYNFLVDRHGQVFEGRAGGIDEPVLGAQAGGYNAFSTGVGCLGSFSATRETAAGVRALAHLIAWKLALHGVPAKGRTTVRVSPSGSQFSRFPANARVSLQRISGHRDADSTSCPGNALYAQLPRLRTVVRRLAGNFSTLTISASPPNTGQVTLAGRLQTSKGAAIAGASIEIQQRGPSGQQTLATAATGGDGSWSAVVHLSQNALLRALFRGGNGHSAVVSNLIAEGIGPAVTLAASAASVTANAPLQVSGSVNPARASVELVISRKASNGSYERRRSVTLTVSGGQFGGTISFAAPGEYQLVAQTVADKANAAGSSAPVYVTVT